MFVVVTLRLNYVCISISSAEISIFLFTVPGYQQLTACADTPSVSVKPCKKKPQRAHINKRRREIYHEKKQSTDRCDIERKESIKQRSREAYHAKKEASQMSGEKTKPSKKTCAERSSAYKKRLRGYQENNLHPESIAMENPQFIFPTQGQSKLTIEDIDIVLNRPPLFVPFSSDQGLGNKEIEEPIEMPSAHQTRRQRVPPGERQNHLVRRNLLFEATIGRKYLGPPDAANEIPDVVNAPTQSSVINTGECHLFFYHDSILALFVFDC